ncbi:hypothetical protein BJV74DRAFT_827324 [Russula compacta]|nr:hypothetical protein BJV74DRAFT_827324 [Russula compacta]
MRHVRRRHWQQDPAMDVSRAAAKLRTDDEYYLARPELGAVIGRSRPAALRPRTYARRWCVAIGLQLCTCSGGRPPGIRGQEFAETRPVLVNPGKTLVHAKPQCQALAFAGIRVDSKNGRRKRRRSTRFWNKMIVRRSFAVTSTTIVTDLLTLISTFQSKDSERAPGAFVGKCRILG